MIGQDQQTEKCIGKLSAAPLHFAKFGRLMQTLARLERQFTDRRQSRMLGSRTEALAALRTARAAIGVRSWWPCARENRGYGLDCKLLGLKVRFIAQLEQKPRAKSMDWEIYERRQGY